MIRSNYYLKTVIFLKIYGRFVHSATGFFNISTNPARHMLVETFNYYVITKWPEFGPPLPPCSHLFDFGKPPPTNVHPHLPVTKTVNCVIL